MLNVNLSVENQQVFLPVLKEKQIELFIKREDEIHPFVSGNKYRKLKYNLNEAKSKGCKTILTFGGAYSNHIVATAVAGKLSGFKTIGVIRGDELASNKNLLETNKTLKEASNNGMIFEFISRADYRNKMNPAFLAQLKNKFGEFYIVPEGGTNELAVKGCEEILTPQDENFNYICVAVGTGGTISGLIKSATTNQTVIGFPALKGDFLSEDIKKNISKQNNWQLILDYHFGGYAKYNQELIQFMNQFKKVTNILLDPVYTGKMLFGIMDLIQQNYFKPKSKILVIHTGGLQGIDAMNEKLKKRNFELIEK